MAGHVANNPDFDLTVWNRTAEKASRFGAATGAKVAASPAEAAHGARILITCLPTSREVEQVLEAADPQPGTLVIDCTSGDPETSRRLEKNLAERSVDFIDAPVSGGVIGAEAGTLTVMCGGNENTFDRALPVLKSFGAKVVLCGPVGAGHALKAVNNALLATHIVSLAEGLEALAKSGVNPQLALDIINSSSGRSNTSENLFPQRVVNGAFPRTFKLALLDKDVRIAVEFASQSGVDAQVLKLVSDIYAIAHRQMGEEVDHVEIARLICPSVPGMTTS